jgi:hypothetical protein
VPLSNKSSIYEKVPQNQIHNFEERNNISINFYGCDVDKDKCSPHLLYKSDIYDADKEIDLLYVQDDDNSHYCWIKKFSAFVRHSTEKSQGKMEHCRYCLQRFGSTFKGKTPVKKMDEHLAMGCRQISDVVQRKTKKPSTTNNNPYQNHMDRAFSSLFPNYNV